MRGRTACSAHQARAAVAVEAAEDALFRLGYSDFRVRSRGGQAWLQFIAPQHERAAAELDAIRQALAPHFTAVELDPKPRERSK